MFWVGLGVLVVGTHTTLSVSEDAPVDLAEEAPAGRIEEAEGIVKAEAARLPGTQRPGMHTPQPCSFPEAPPQGRLRVTVRERYFPAVSPTLVPFGWSSRAGNGCLPVRDSRMESSEPAARRADR